MFIAVQLLWRILRQRQKNTLELFLLASLFNCCCFYYCAYNRTRMWCKEHVEPISFLPHSAEEIIHFWNDMRLTNCWQILFVGQLFIYTGRQKMFVYGSCVNGKPLTMSQQDNAIIGWSCQGVPRYIVGTSWKLPVRAEETRQALCCNAADFSLRMDIFSICKPLFFEKCPRGVWK